MRAWMVTAMGPAVMEMEGNLGPFGRTEARANAVDFLLDFYIPYRWVFH